jgi:type IV pilus assembly protein PilO
VASNVGAKFQKVPTTQKVLLALLLLVGLAAGWFFLYYSPKLDELKAKDEEKAQVEAQLRQALDDYRAWVQVSQDLETARGELEQLNKLLPVSRDVEGLMTALNAKAKDSQLRLTNIVPEEEAEDDAGMYIRIPIKIEFRGSYHQLLQFLHLVDTGVERLVNIENIDLSTDTTEDGPVLLKGSLLATTFMAKEPGSETEE